MSRCTCLKASPRLGPVMCCVTSITSICLKPSPLRMRRRCAVTQDGVKRPFGGLKASGRDSLERISMKCICMFVVPRQRKTLQEEAASSFSSSCVSHDAGSANQANFCTRDVSTVNRFFFFHFSKCTFNRFASVADVEDSLVASRIMTLVDTRVEKPVRFLTDCDTE